MPDTSSQPDFKSFIVAPPVALEMAAHPDQPISVIISFQESGKGLQQGISKSKNDIKAVLEEAGYKYLESDFYLFARLEPAQIQLLAQKYKAAYRRT